MTLAVVTGSHGLIGSETVDYFCSRGFDVIGIDNDMRRQFFGEEASTAWMRERLRQAHPARYRHEDIDIRDRDAIDRVFGSGGRHIGLVVHTAAQPSHDWAASDPETDFTVNANGTLNVLEAVRRHSADAVFIFTSTNKVYGDRPNELPLIEHETRWEIESTHRFHGGIDESMSVDACTHSLFGASKLAADVLVQEYGRYFGLRTATFRGGCLTGPNHSGTQLHGFLAYLMKCVCTGRPYTVFGYGGKQVRDNIHSLDLVGAFHQFFLRPRVGEVYNIGGARHSNCSMREAIALCEDISGMRLEWSYSDKHRVGDHRWYISDIGKFQRHYPEWRLQYDLRALLEDLYDRNVERWRAEARGKELGVR